MDSFEKEIKRIMEEETSDIVLSKKAMDNILGHRKKNIKERIDGLLNKEIKIPIAPVIIGFTALFAIALIPWNLSDFQSVKIIDMGGSQVIISESREVGMK